MITLISLIAALALAAIPISIGWRRTVDEAGMARAMGIAQPKKNFDPEKFARQTGTGLAFNQIAYGFLAWVGGGLAGGIVPRSLSCDPVCDCRRIIVCRHARR